MSGRGKGEKWKRQSSAPHMPPKCHRPTTSQVGSSSEGSETPTTCQESRGGKAEQLLTNSVHNTGMSGGHAANCTIIGVQHNTCNCGYAELEKLKVSDDDLKPWTKGMIKVSAVDMVMKKFNTGQCWVTITGNAGDGKSTAGYLVLESRRSKDIYKVNTPQEFAHVSKLKTDCTILLDDIFGMFTFDKTAFDKCLPHINSILETHEKEAKEERKPRILFTTRWNVLQSAKDYLGRCNQISDQKCVVNLGDMKIKEERLDILNYHLDRKHIRVAEYVKERVVTHHAPHGFAHCCKMYAEMPKDKYIDIEAFFRKPLDFLDETTCVLLKTEQYKHLFETVIKSDGKLDICDINEDKEGASLTTAFNELLGSYIHKISGLVQFAHPSIYESVLNGIGQKDILFIIKYASLSILRQKGHIKKHEQDVSPKYFNFDHSPGQLDALSKRFRNEFLKRNFSVFEHEFCDNRDFCKSLLKNCVNTNPPPHQAKVLNDFDGDPQKGELTVKARESISVLRQTYTEKALPWERRTLYWKAINPRGDQGLIPDHYVEVTEPPGIDCQDWRGQTMLCIAARCGRYVAVLLDHGADVNIADEYGMTPLHYLCKSGEADVSTIQLLITHGADVNIVDDGGMTLLHYLCKSGKADVSTIQLLLTPNTDVNIADRYGKTPLRYLCKSGKADVSTIQLLITHGADVNIVDDGGKTPLHHLCKSGKADVSTIQLLLTPNTDVNIADEYGKTPLHYLCQSGKADVSTIQLITPDTDVNIADAYGKTPLHYLCQSGKPDVSIIQVLITANTDMNKADRFGRTALHYLCQSGKPDVSIIQALMTHEASMNIADNYGKTPLHYLCQSGKPDVRIIKVLINADTDVNTADKHGQTPLHYLCQSSKPDPNTIRLLTTHKADVNIADRYGKTPLHYLFARSKADISTLQLLITHKADVNIADRDGRTPLQYLYERAIALKELDEETLIWQNNDTEKYTDEDYYTTVVMVETSPDPMIAENEKIRSASEQLNKDAQQCLDASLLSIRKGSCIFSFLHKNADKLLTKMKEVVRLISKFVRGLGSNTTINYIIVLGPDSKGTINIQIITDFQANNVAIGKDCVINVGASSQPKGT